MKLPNLHNHTSRCGHATGTIDEYIEEAVNRDLYWFGFADHAPLPEELRSGITMEPSETEDYLHDIFSARERWNDRCEILAAFEVDFPLFETFDKAYLHDSRIDYLIGSCHFIDDWPFDHDDYIEEFDRRDIDDIYQQYFSIIEELVDSGYFQVIGHFDLVKKFGHLATESFSPQIRAIAAKMATRGIAAEINTSGLIKPIKEIYPAKEIIQIFYQEGVPLTLGSDSHAPGHVGYGFDKAVALLKDVGYTSVCYFKERNRHDVPLEQHK